RDEDARDLLVHGRRQQTERLDTRLLRCEGWIVRVGAERRVHLRRYLSEPPEPVEEALGRRGDLPERHIPAADRSGDVLLQQPESGRERPAGVRVPAAECRVAAEAVLGEEAEHLELRVDPRLETAEDLEDQRVVEDDGAVRL